MIALSEGSRSITRAGNGAAPAEIRIRTSDN
jgi:hypothetical protein